MASRFLYPQNNLLYGQQSVPVPVEDQVTGLLPYGLGVGAFAAFGNIPVWGQKTGFDALVQGIRLAEEYSPARILRTFQGSQILSPLETASRGMRYLSPNQIRAMRQTPAGKAWLEHLQRLLGGSYLPDEVRAQGLRYEAGQFLVGRTSNQVLLQHAGIIRNPMGQTPQFTEGYIRSLAGGPVANIRQALTTPVSYLTAAGQEASELWLPVGGRSRLQSAGRYLGGLGTAAVERFNRLLSDVGDLLPSNRFTRGLGKFLTTEPSSGLRTLGKLAGKFGLIIPAAYYGYDLLDWGVRQALPGTGGITGIGIGFAKGFNLLTSRVAEITGGHALREWQEEVAPGSTDFSRLMAFPIMGGLAGAGINYAARVQRQAAYQSKGFSLREASLLSAGEKPYMLEALYHQEIPKELAPLMRPEMVSELRDLTVKRLSGIRGTIARRIVAAQDQRTVTGWLARRLGKVTPSKIAGLFGTALGSLVIAPFVPGALVPSERPEELERLYNGQQLVPVRKSRFWEISRSPYEGGRIDRFVQHPFVRWTNHDDDIELYGGDYPAIAQFFIKNFTYDIERRHYADRPYPITGQAFEDIPLIGPVLSATLGRLIKPGKIMHPEMYQEGPGGEGALPAMPLRKGERAPNAELGERAPGMPIDPYGLSATVDEQLYRMTEMTGLWGWASGAIKERMTGTSDFAAQETRLQTASDMYRSGKSFWEEEVGGALGLSETYRRLYPSQRKIPEWNAIPNQLAGIDWLPGEGDRSMNFKVGDPYSGLPQGAYRLPGPVYEKMHPELAGVDPNDWPLVAKLRVLGDVAIYSEKYKNTEAQVRAAARAGTLSQEDIVAAREILDQVQQKKATKQFHPYLYQEKALPPAAALLAAANEQSKEDSGPSWFSKTIGSYWEELSHSAETPLDYLTPVSPGMKLVHMRTATEDYERTQAWGTEASYWQHPVRDFVNPFVAATKHMLGNDEIPEDLQRRRDIEEYFDILKYMKLRMIENQSRAEGDEETAISAAKGRAATLFGINPYNRNYGTVFQALPRRERDYFSDFVGADMNERAKILDMVPDNEKALYIAQWQMKDAADLSQAVEKGLVTGNQLEQAKTEVADLFESMDTEGMPKDTELWGEYLSNRMRGESYPDWYRRTYLLDQRLKGRALPGPNWVGFRPEVDLDDIKLKVVENVGDSIYDYDLWQDRRRAVAYKPYVSDAASEVQTAMSRHLDTEALRRSVMDILEGHNVRDSRVFITPTAGKTGFDVRMNLDEDRSADAERVIKRGLN